MTTAIKFTATVTPIDKGAIYEMMETAASSAMKTWLNKVATDARQLAPVRKVFRQGRQKEQWVTVFEHAGGQGEAATAYGKAYAKYETPLGPSRSQRYRQLRETVTAKREGRTARKIAATPRHRAVTTGAGANMVTKLQVRRVRSERQIDPRRSAWSPAGRNPVGPLYEAVTSTAIRSAISDGKRTVYADTQSRFLQFDAWNQLSRAGQRDLVKRGTERFEAGAENDTKASIEKPGSMSGAISAEVNSMIVPQQGGRLKKSITADAPIKTGKSVTGTVSANVRYARYVEFGTQRHGAAQPYLRPALWRNKKLLVVAFESDARKAFGGAYRGSRGKRG